MANLAIKGHATRDKEVIEILEMLGGKNKQEVGAIRETCVYFIDGGTISLLKINQLLPEHFIVFTLEEFLEKFPYKVGDKVKVKETEKEVTIEGMSWRNGCEVIYDTCYKNDCVAFYSAEELQPYKEETMTEASKAVFDVNAQCCDIMNHLIKEETMEEQITIEDITLEKAFMCTFLEMVEGKQRLRIALNEGFELKEENGNFFVCRKKVEYPKTYEECCRIINYRFAGTTIIGHKKSLLENFQKLLIYRDAYWKIAGEQMGLGKAWEPDFTNDKPKYCLYVDENIIEYDTVFYINYILAFPTVEMRDAFYENFKDLIEKCKELL